MIASTDTSIAENGKAEESKGESVVFTKRSRGSKARKRPRSYTDEEESSGHLPVSYIPKKESRKETGPQWTKETFESGANTTPGGSGATAERLDVGGEKQARPEEKAKKPFGPLSAPSHLRTSVRVDYQPDVCKDYKETGYCGFGDSCKFLHDRSDYKAGWQLDREWAKKEKRRTDKIMRGEDPDAQDFANNRKEFDDDGLPFACFICRKDFKRPVMTLCAHYFCEACILVKMETSSVCPVCKKPLRGTLNPAPKLQSRLEQRQN